jgi:DNA primase
MINLLNRIEDSNQRTHYIGYCAQLLSQGDNRLIPLHTNNLFNQLKKPNLRSGDTKNKSSSVIVPTNGENSLLERAESLLLLIYLHSPERREEIIYTLEAKDLLFTLSQHRFLWQQIVEVENISRQKPGNLGDRLISLLQERCVDFFDQIAQIQHLFYLNEQTREDLDRANLLIRSAIAAMEKVACEKYRRYCLSQLQEIDPTQETKLGWHYWQELEKTEQKIKQLEKERLFSNLEVFGAR